LQQCIVVFRRRAVLRIGAEIAALENRLVAKRKGKKLDMPLLLLFALGRIQRLLQRQYLDSFLQAISGAVLQRHFGDDADGAKSGACRLIKLVVLLR